MQGTQPALTKSSYIKSAHAGTPADNSTREENDKDDHAPTRNKRDERRTSRAQDKSLAPTSIPNPPRSVPQNPASNRETSTRAGRSISLASGIPPTPQFHVRNATGQR